MDLSLKRSCKNSLVLLLALLLLGACQQQDNPLPTTAPRIPTITLTLSSTNAPTFTPATIPPTAERDLPSWTPTETATTAPTNTLRPTRTITPSPSPTAAASSAEVLPSGAIRLTIPSAELNTDNTIFEIESDTLILSIQLLNTFLGQTSNVRANTTLSLIENQLTLELQDFSSEGPQVTRQQVQDEVNKIAGVMNTIIQAKFREAIQQETDLQILDFDLLPNFLIVDITIP